MKFHQLEYFLAVVKWKSFTRAAEENNIAQSSLSIQIKKLESGLGVRLFERTTRSLVLTRAGKEFKGAAEHILCEADEIKASLERFVSAKRGNICIGAFPGSRYFGFIDLISRFKAAYPEVEFELREEECSPLLSALESCEIDVAFTSLNSGAEDVVFHPMHEDKLVFVIGQGHSLAKKSSVALRDLVEEPLVFNAETTIYSVVMKAFEECGVIPRVVLCTHGHLSSTLGFVSSGMGGTMISSRVARFYEERGFAFLPIEPPIPRTTWLAVPKGGGELPVVSNFVEFILAERGLVTPD